MQSVQRLCNDSAIDLQRNQIGQFLTSLGIPAVSDTPVTGQFFSNPNG
jgi:hypothetical protein